MRDAAAREWSLSYCWDAHVLEQYGHLSYGENPPLLYESLRLITVSDSVTLRASGRSIQNFGNHEANVHLKKLKWGLNCIAAALPGWQAGTQADSDPSLAESSPGARPNMIR